MKWSGCCLLATLAVLWLMDAHTTHAAPSPRTDDLLKTLQDLEQIYSSMARPSVRSGSVIEPEMSKKVQRAMKMIEMQQLERLYAHRARPRFGKRDPVINTNSFYRNLDSEYPDLQSIDDGHVPVAKWRVDGMVPDTEMRSVSGRISSRDTSPSSMRQRQLQKLQHLYQYQLN